MIKVGSDFSGIGAFNQALKRAGIKHREVFACDWDDYARDTFILNYGAPPYFPKDVYDREIPEDPLDIYMTSPPCQSFSLAGKRLGENDERGILFYNSHEFIKKNKPRYFIFENVKGLLSDNKKSSKDKIGQTFQSWITLLGGKSVNGVLSFMPHDDAVPYHIYYKVINAKKQGVPQNRERVFIVGIRDDQDNNFTFPSEIPLQKTVGDILEQDVDQKYFLKGKMLEGYMESENGQAFINQNTQASKVSDQNGVYPTLSAGSKGYSNGYVKVEAATEVRTEEAKAERRRTGTHGFRQKKIEFRESEIMNCIATSQRTNNIVRICAIRGRYNKETGKLEQTLEVNKLGISNSLTTVQKDNVVKIGVWRDFKDSKGFREIKDGTCPSLLARAREDGSGQPVVVIDYIIRRLTPRECARLMDFPEDFIWEVSDTQAYKQFGNSIVVGCLLGIIKKFNLS